MPPKINFSNQTKLQTLSDKEPDQGDKILQKQKFYPLSFRLRQVDMERMKRTLKEINKIRYGEPLKKTDLIRGLLVLSEKTSPEKLVKHIKESI